MISNSNIFSPLVRLKPDTHWLALVAPPVQVCALLLRCWHPHGDDQKPTKRCSTQQKQQNTRERGLAHSKPTAMKYEDSAAAASSAGPASINRRINPFLCETHVHVYGLLGIFFHWQMIGSHGTGRKIVSKLLIKFWFSSAYLF